VNVRRQVELRRVKRLACRSIVSPPLSDGPERLFHTKIFG
jgi:hypothetical protein